MNHTVLVPYSETCLSDCPWATKQWKSVGGSEVEINAFGTLLCEKIVLHRQQDVDLSLLATNLTAYPYGYSYDEIFLSTWL